MVNIMTRAAAKVGGGASVRGRILAQNAVISLDNSVITRPSTVAFRATQAATGVSLEQYNNDPEVNSGTLKHAIDDSMTGVLPDNIYGFEVSAEPTTESVAPDVQFLRTSFSASALSA